MVGPPKLAAFDLVDGAGPNVESFDEFVAAARRQWLVVFVAVAIGMAAGILYIVMAAPRYTATTDLLIDSQKDKNELAASIADLTFDSSAIDSQVEVLKSEKIALSVIAALKLTTDGGFVGKQGVDWSEIVHEIRMASDPTVWFATREPPRAGDVDPALRAAVIKLRDNLAVSRIGRTYVLAISFTSPDAVKASDIANAFAEAYLNEQLEARFESTRRAAAWMEARLAELKTQSIASDLATQKFKSAHGIVVTGGDRPGLISDQKLSELNMQIVAAQSETARADARYQQIEDLLKSGRSGVAVPDSLSNPVINDIRAKYLAASKNEAQLQSKLGSGHYQVIQLKREMAEYERLIYEELERIAESYRSDAEVARGKERALASSMSSLVGQSVITNETLVQLRELEREADTYRSLYQTFLQRYQQALQQQSFPETEARVITAASTPQSPSHPNRPLVLALSLAAGLAGGVGIATLREHLDRAFRSADQVSADLGLELIGQLPYIERGAEADIEDQQTPSPQHIRQTDPLLRHALGHPLSSFSEALRAAKVAVDFSLPDRPSKVLGVISVLANEGKSTVAKNLASLLAHAGLPTLLIDADLRSPGLSARIAPHAELGLIEILEQGAPFSDCLLMEAESGLYVLPAAAKERIVHSGELVSSANMRLLLNEAGRSFEYVIVDLPPLAPVVDVRAAMALFDCFLVVAEWGRTPRAMFKDTLLKNEAVYAKCAGVVYNKVRMDLLSLYDGYTTHCREAAAPKTRRAGRNGALPSDRHA